MSTCGEVRLARGLSLEDVERATSGEIGTAVLSVYERGQRQIPTHRMFLLANLYAISLDQLKETAQPVVPGPTVRKQPSEVGIRFDLPKLEAAKGPEVRAVLNLVRAIENRRGRHENDSISLRHEDLVAAAATIGRPYEVFVDALKKAGVFRRRRGRPPG